MQAGLNSVAARRWQKPIFESRSVYFRMLGNIALVVAGGFHWGSNRLWSVTFPKKTVAGIPMPSRNDQNSPKQGENAPVEETDKYDWSLRVLNEAGISMPSGYSPLKNFQQP
jgi:hypothetical protein